MNNHLLSIDPSMKNTGFVLWEKEEYHQRCVNDCIKYLMDCDCEESNTQYEWEPIWVGSYNFNKYDYQEWMRYIDTIYKNEIDNLDLIIEGGFNNPKMARGNETLGHLRGFIGGQFNKLIKKENLIRPSERRKYYWDNYGNEIAFIQGLNNLPKDKKWHKELFAMTLTNLLMTNNNWNITISNHDEAEALLIGWAKINEKNT